MTDKILTQDQIVAVDKIQSWLSRPNDPYMLLAGYAGTGKTYIMSQLAENPNILFTAPTNKATKELTKSINKPAKTTFSVFGLRMEQVGEELILSPGPVLPTFSRGTVVCIDEASYVNEVLFDAADKIKSRCGAKILYVGDPLQLPPVKERSSKVWRLSLPESNVAILKKVVRHDNQILTLATNIRTNIQAETYETPLQSDNDGKEGVWKYKSHAHFEKDLLKSMYDDVKNTRFISWRNRVVNEYNTKIRTIFGFKNTFDVGDILLMAEPVKVGDEVLAHVDDEFIVQSVEDDYVEVDGYKIPVDVLVVSNEEKALTLKIPQSEVILHEILSKRARLARNAKDGDAKKQLWRSFWALKEKFQAVRYGYALTAHRMQGSTTRNVFMDQNDILSNSESLEAMKCLYVTSTRPTTRLVTF